MALRIAILLRGPSGVGKSTIGQLLLDRFSLNPANLVNLDLGWGGNLGSERLGPDPYADLRTNDPILVMELACGERRDGRGRGATRDPDKWRTVLREARQLVVSQGRHNKPASAKGGESCPRCRCVLEA